MRRLAPLLLLTACSSVVPPSAPSISSPSSTKPACYRLPPEQWGACLERARQIDFNVYECERRALLLKPVVTTSGEKADE